MFYTLYLRLYMKMKYILFSLFVCLLCISAIKADNIELSDRVYIKPEKQTGVTCSSLSLNGVWNFKYSAESKWTTIKVPGEVAMQGYAIKHDKPFVYKKEFVIPADYSNRNIILRFDGVYSYARLTVNGEYVREHHGGFTRWETDITLFVKPGKKNRIELEVTDRLDEISYASGYAHHPIGGILRDVTLFALPKTHLYDVSVETHLDSLYEDAILQLACSYVVEDEAEVVLNLTDPDGKMVNLRQNRFPLLHKKEQQYLKIPVENPVKWDAEHPNLYSLSVSVCQEGKELYSFTRKVGFRKIEIKGDKMFVNGKQVKLRGACRHDIHPLLGRTTTSELDSLDVMLFKEANMNFVRTSHYPPSEMFLEYCDRYGIYVECEAAVCFVNTHRQKNYAPAATQNNPEFTGRYLGQCREMVRNFCLHPSILFWSIGNESTYGSNFQKCWEWVKANDLTRPVIFSYPGSQDKDAVKIYDILSMHYQDVNGNLNQWGMETHGFQGHGIPALYDEWAHPACYTYATLQNDPNIREFWGKSLDLMWGGLFDAPGGLGGAIWGYIDELFMLPTPKIGKPFWKEFAHTAKPENYQGNCVGYGEWGIVDIWRRQKPEFWSTKKAYSPIRILIKGIMDFVAGQQLMIPVYNRFDHTYLNEIQMIYTYKGVQESLSLPDIAPHQKGVVLIPAKEWENGEKLFIEFLTSTGEQIDAYELVLGKERITYPALLDGKVLTVNETDSLYIVSGNGFEIPFDKITGLITGARVGDKILIEKGPFLNLDINLNHLSGAEIRKVADNFKIQDSEWSKSRFHIYKQGENVYVDLTGTYQRVAVGFHIKITPSAQFFINYLVSGIPNGFIRESGLSFCLSETLQMLDWERKGYWDYYPENDFAGNKGCTPLYFLEHVAYGERPFQTWQMDTHDYYYWADAGAGCRKPLTQIAKGMKENIHYYRLSTNGDTRHALSVISSDASVACRINKLANEKLVFYVNNRWDYPEIAWGNYCKRVEAVPCFGTIQMALF